MPRGAAWRSRVLADELQILPPANLRLSRCGLCRGRRRSVACSVCRRPSAGADPQRRRPIGRGDAGAARRRDQGVAPSPRGADDNGAVARRTGDAAGVDRGAGVMAGVDSRAARVALDCCRSGRSMGLGRGGSGRGRWGVGRAPSTSLRLVPLPVNGEDFLAPPRGRGGGAERRRGRALVGRLRPGGGWMPDCCARFGNSLGRSFVRHAPSTGLRPVPLPVNGEDLLAPPRWRGGGAERRRGVALVGRLRPGGGWLRGCWVRVGNSLGQRFVRRAPSTSLWLVPLPVNGEDCGSFSPAAGVAR